MNECRQTRCRFCYTEMGIPVCTVEPVLMHPAESRVFILKCNTYLKRDEGDSLRPWSPKAADGLYPGQLRPPRDLSHYDADDPTPVDLDGNGKDCKA